MNNDKSLENQTSELGKYLKDLNVSSQCRNMFKTLSDYYGNYQNTFIKHYDNVNSKEVDFIVNLTSSLIYFLIHKTKEL